jgi:hypothetical protein
MEGKVDIIQFNLHFHGITLIFGQQGTVGKRNGPDFRHPSFGRFKVSEALPCFLIIDSYVEYLFYVVVLYRVVNFDAFQLFVRQPGEFSVQMDDIGKGGRNSRQDGVLDLRFETVRYTGVKQRMRFIDCNRHVPDGSLLGVKGGGQKKLRQDNQTRQNPKFAKKHTKAFYHESLYPRLRNF